MTAGVGYIWRAAAVDGLTSSPPMWTCSLGNSSKTSFKTVSKKLKVPSFPCLAMCPLTGTPQRTHCLNCWSTSCRQSWQFFGGRNCMQRLAPACQEKPKDLSTVLTAQKTSSCTPHCTGTCDMSFAPACAWQSLHMQPSMLSWHDLHCFGRAVLTYILAMTNTGSSLSALHAWSGRQPIQDLCSLGSGPHMRGADSRPVLRRSALEAQSPAPL